MKHSKGITCKIHTCFIFFLLSQNLLRGQVCSGSWTLQRPASVQCVVGQWIGWQNTNEPVGCPINPSYVGTQSNTFTFENPASDFSIDFFGFDGSPFCARMAIAINGIFYPLTTSNLFDLPQGSTCVAGSFNYIMLTSDGYITEGSSGGPDYIGKGRINVSNVNATTVSISTNDGYGITVSDPFNCVEVIPLYLISFDGTNTSSCTVRLNWQTGVEENIKNIEVQRSGNGIIFKTNALVSPKGSNSNYSFETVNEVDGYFRLKINDFDGNFRFSKIIHVQAHCNQFPYTITPNPSNGIISLSGLSGTEKILINDIAGRKVLSFNNTLTNEFDIGKLSRGIYVVRILQDNICKAHLKVIRN